jgi:hypothetical protein
MEQQIIITNNDSPATVYATPEGHYVMAVPIDDGSESGGQSIINVPLILTADGTLGGPIQLDNIEQSTVSIEDGSTLNTHNLVIRTPVKKQPVYPPGAQVMYFKFLRFMSYSNTLNTLFFSWSLCLMRPQDSA